MKSRDGEKKAGRNVRLIGPALLLAAAAAWAAWSLHTAAAGPAPREVGYGCGGQGPAFTLRETAESAGGGAECNNAAKFIMGRRMDLNSATEADLDLIPGIGPETARRVVEYREQAGGFRGLDDLDRVPVPGREARAGLKSWTDVK